MMKVIIAKTEAEMNNAGADLIEQLLKEKPDACLGLATGSSPVGMYQELIRRCEAGQVDFSKACSVNLDEYVGLTGEHPQSYRYFMNEQLFNHVNIDKARTTVACGVGDPEENLAAFRGEIAAKPRDIQVLGVGVDGHIAFNEPGEVLHGLAHMETLDESTIEANQRFFASRDDVPRKAFTMGMAEIMHARKLLLLVNGASKAKAISQLLLTDEITTANPVTMVRLHPDVTVVMGQELADAIGYKA